MWQLTEVSDLTESLSEAFNGMLWPPNPFAKKTEEIKWKFPLT